MFLRSLNVCFMNLGEKEFKKPILDELGQTEQILKIGEEI